MFKKIFFIIPVFFLASCLNEDTGFDYTAGQYEVLFSAMLSEYNQADETIYSFTYKGWNLNTMTFHRKYGDLVFQFEYDDNKLPVMASGVYSERNFQFFFYYTDGLLSLMEQKVDDVLFKETLFTHDDQDRIVKTIETTNGTSTRIREYTWEEFNIVKIEAYPRVAGKDFAQIYEFEYDDQEQPLRPAFHFIGYNLIEEIPIVFNNWEKVTIYNALNPTAKEVAVKEYDYYANGFPYRERLQYKDIYGDNRESVTDFVY